MFLDFKHLTGDMEIKYEMEKENEHLINIKSGENRIRIIH